MSREGTMLDRILTNIAGPHGGGFVIIAMTGTITALISMVWLALR